MKTIGTFIVVLGSVLGTSDIINHSISKEHWGLDSNYFSEQVSGRHKYWKRAWGLILGSLVHLLNSWTMFHNAGI
jgi:hypothetical protein